MYIPDKISEQYILQDKENHYFITSVDIKT